MTDEPGKEVAPHVPPPSVDPEQLRKFEEFQRFQEFQRWQEAHGGGTPPPAAPADRRYRFGKPLWLIVLGSKLFWRLLFLVLAVIGALWAYNHYFGAEDPGNVAVDSGGVTGNVIAPTAPAGLQGTVGVLYKHVAHGSDTKACDLFLRDDEKRKFASAFSAADCPAAVRSLKQKVTAVNQYEQPQFPPEMLKTPTSDSVTIDSCALTIGGGPRLGTFTLTKQINNTWVITGYAPSTCG